MTAILCPQHEMPMPLQPNQDVFITCAVTGSGETADKSDKVPVTPEEIANSDIDAARAGAAIVHCHVRDPKTGKPSRDLVPLPGEEKVPANGCLLLGEKGVLLCPHGGNPRLLPAGELKRLVIHLAEPKLDIGPLPPCLALALMHVPGIDHALHPMVILQHEGVAEGRVIDRLEDHLIGLEPWRAPETAGEPAGDAKPDTKGEEKQ